MVESSRSRDPEFFRFLEGLSWELSGFAGLQLREIANLRIAESRDCGFEDCGVAGLRIRGLRSCGLRLCGVADCGCVGLDLRIKYLDCERI
eukprot:10186831-Alexandrium_andersonii.AAC.1